MPSSKNIIIGAAAVFVGPSISSYAGANDTARIAAWKSNLVVSSETGSNSFLSDMRNSTPAGWRDAGYTTEGLQVATDPSWTDVEVDQLLDAAKIFKDKMTLNVSTSFAEATLENLLEAWGQSSSFVQNQTSTIREIGIEGGSLGQAPVEKGLVAVGNGVEHTTSNAYTERTYFAYRAFSVEANTHTLARAEATVIPVTFRCLPADTGRYGTVRDRLLVNNPVSPGTY